MDEDGIPRMGGEQVVPGVNPRGIRGVAPDGQDTAAHGALFCGRKERLEPFAGLEFGLDSAQTIACFGPTTTSTTSGLRPGCQKAFIQFVVGAIGRRR